ncbi:sulfite exporter TauE/SafE family protein [Natranaeroarchaeum aerophilus]|uniref:Probable membrane transporter protein n=1 Tax=Natranaeroarchaeum aerophilus TaxID=2917711 RepID=A0AAE3FQZ3_9EURY|nr:sulfite exporter TauE/SafE family protein [Natranaeroarchaeum aerophilus]MCL9814042.1 sulfite exporter TauE/SafE family protein [Natranaeroarchaeum aerophilus]
MIDSLASVAALIAVIVLAGAVNGLAGFGFAVVATMALATVIDPATAVVFMIVPILGVNLSLVGEVSGEQLRTCGRRFAPLLIAALVGMIVGMVALDALPDAPLRVGLGLVTLAFVGSLQRAVSIPAVSRAKEACFVESTGGMAAVGLVSGVLFGATNVGVQLVAYLKSCNLSHGLFVGVTAMLFLGLNAVRVGTAGALGLYPDSLVFLASVAATVPAVAGVLIGKRLRHRIGESLRRRVVLALLTIIGIRLLLGGAGIA